MEHYGWCLKMEYEEDIMSNTFSTRIEYQSEVLDFLKNLAEYLIWENETREFLNNLNNNVLLLIHETKHELSIMEEFISPLRKQSRELKKENDLLRQRLKEERSFKNIFLDLFRKLSGRI